MLKVLNDIYSFFYYPLKRFLKNFFSLVRWVFLFVYKTDKFEVLLKVTIKVVILVSFLLLLFNVLFVYDTFNLISVGGLHHYNYTNYRHFIYAFLFLFFYIYRLIAIFIINNDYLSAKLPNVLIKILKNSNLFLGTSDGLNESSKLYKNIFLLFLYIKLFSTKTKILINYVVVLLKKFFLHYFGFVIRLQTIFFKNCVYQTTKLFFIFWRPLFKKLSYFGLFRSYRTKWFWKN